MEAYLDNSATTKCAREVVETVVKAMQDDYGNPSSKHMKGVDAEQYIKQAAATIARSLKCQEKELLSEVVHWIDSWLENNPEGDIVKNIRTRLKEIALGNEG